MKRVIKEVVTISKPAIKPNESENDYVARYIPWCIENEGLTASQADGKCHGMYQGKNEHKKYNLGLNELIIPELKTEKSFEMAQSRYEMGTYIAPDSFEVGNIKIEKGQELHYILGVVLEPETIDATRTDETIGAFNRFWYSYFFGNSFFYS